MATGEGGAVGPDPEADRQLLEVLDSEVYIDLRRLRDSARNGVPADLRQRVWMYLLQVSTLDKSEEVSHVKRQLEMYQAVVKHVRPGDASMTDVLQCFKHHYPTLFADAKARQKAEEVLACYLATHRHAPPFFTEALVHILRPFILFDTPQNTYFCFTAFMSMIGPLFTVEGLRHATASLLMLMQHTLPDLYAHFCEERLEANQWVIEWLACLLSKQLPLEDTLQLWDKYLVMGLEEGFSLHPYVCLALLQHHQEKLLDRDSAELLRFLRRLPQTNIEMVIRGAYNMREFVISQDLL